MGEAAEHGILQDGGPSIDGALESPTGQSGTAGRATSSRAGATVEPLLGSLSELLDSGSGPLRTHSGCAGGLRAESDGTKAVYGAEQAVNASRATSAAAAAMAGTCDNGMGKVVPSLSRTRFIASKLHRAGQFGVLRGVTVRQPARSLHLLSLMPGTIAMPGQPLSGGEVASGSCW